MGYEIVVFGDIFSIKKGVKVTQNETGKNRYLSTEDLDNNYKIKYCIDNNNKYVVVNPKDILIAWDGSVGKFRHGLKGIIGSTIARLRINKIYSESFSTKYIAYFLLTKKEYLINTSTGATIKHINRKSLEKIKVPLLSMRTQTRIVSYLDKAQELIDSRKRQIEKYDELLQSVFFDMFGDPVTNPKGWEKKEIKEICEKIVDCPHSTPEYSEEQTGLYCIRSSDIQKGYLDFSHTRQVEKSTFDERNRRCIPLYKDIVFTREGGRLANLAKIPLEEKVCLGQRIMLFRVKPLILTSEFFWSVLRTNSFQTYIKQLAGGGAAPRVNIKDVIKLSTPLPPLKLQNQFASIVEKVEMEKKICEESLRQMENNFNSIMQRAFKGELF